MIEHMTPPTKDGVHVYDGVVDAAPLLDQMLDHIRESSKRGQKKIENKNTFFHGLNRNCYKPHMNDIHLTHLPHHHVYVYVCMHACIYVCMYMCMCVCMLVYMYACLYASMYACMHVCMYVCMYACMHVSMNIYTHTCIVSPVQVEASSGDATIRSRA